MVVYKVSLFHRGKTYLHYAVSQAEARTIGSALMETHEVKRSAVSVDKMDIPYGKDAFVAWLNGFVTEVRDVDRQPA